MCCSLPSSSSRPRRSRVVKVHSPITQAADNLGKPQTRAITLTADGAVYLDAYPVDMDQLRASLGQYKAANPNLPVVLKADSAAQ